MKKTIASVALSLALMSSTAMAEERATAAASAVVRRPIGAVAGAVHRLFGRTVDSARQSRSVSRREQGVPTGESQPDSTPPAPQDQAAPQAVAPTRPATTASTAPPVQPLE
jgi:hypothetical protein